MLYDELPIAFPAYTKIEQQDRYNENVEAICDFRLITPKDAFLPFQFRKPPSGALPVLWELYEVNSEVKVADVSDSIPALRVRKVEGKEYYSYDGRRLSTGAGFLNMAPGFYYWRMNWGDGFFMWSEMFHVPDADAFNIQDDDLVNFMKLEWFNDADIKPIFYNDKRPTDGKPYFRNVLYLDAFVTDSQPQILEDGERDGEDELIPTFQKGIIPYTINLLVPDFLKKALIMMQMHDHVIITTKQGIRSGEILKCVVNSSREAGGGLSVVDILFQEIILTKKACAKNMESDCIGDAPTLSPIEEAGGNVLIIGTAPAGTQVNVYLLTSEGAPAENILTSISQAAFTAGVSIPVGDLAAGTHIKVEAFYFGCNFGFSTVRQIP